MPLLVLTVGQKGVRKSLQLLKRGEAVMPGSAERHCVIHREGTEQAQEYIDQFPTSGEGSVDR